jgi:hypothetical protein
MLIVHTYTKGSTCTCTYMYIHEMSVHWKHAYTQGWSWERVHQATVYNTCARCLHWVSNNVCIADVCLMRMITAVSRTRVAFTMVIVKKNHWFDYCFLFPVLTYLPCVMYFLRNSEAIILFTAAYVHRKYIFYGSLQFVIRDISFHAQTSGEQIHELLVTRLPILCITREGHILPVVFLAANIDLLMSPT